MNLTNIWRLDDSFFITLIILSQAIDENNNLLSTVPLIPPNELSLEYNEPIGSGSYSDVFSGTWLHQPVAVKRLRVKPQSAPMHQLKIETTISISLYHPNIVRVFGMTKMENSYMGIVMELADKVRLKTQLAVSFTLLTLYFV